MVASTKNSAIFVVDDRDEFDCSTSKNGHHCVTSFVERPMFARVKNLNSLQEVALFAAARSSHPVFLAASTCKARTETGRGQRLQRIL